ncbi:hypothetical protein STRTUCAR8_03877, partial [Streptomyces turgidiscabies Car8]
MGRPAPSARPAFEDKARSGPAAEVWGRSPQERDGTGKG